MTLRHKLFRNLMRTPAYNAMLGSGGQKKVRAPNTINFPWPQDLSVANAIMHGHFTLAGGTCAIDDNIWKTNGPTETWFEAVHGFLWLNDLISPKHPDTGKKAAFLIDKWIDQHFNYSMKVWRSDFTGRRVINWACFAKQLFEVSGPSFQDRFCQSISRQIRHLRRAAQFDCDGAARIAALVGLIAGETILSNQGEVSGRSAKALKIELKRQVLADGVHGSRSPEAHLDVLCDLILLRELLINTGVTVPESLFNAIDRMTPILRFFRHGDGALSQFNGGGETSKGLIDHVLKVAASNGKAPMRAPHAGFERLAAGDMTVILDTGTPNLFPSLNPLGHASSLSMELSVGTERLIVNCGCRLNLNSDWRWACRFTAAHSTLVVAETNSCELIKTGGARKTPVIVDSDRGDADGDCWLSASHNGYVSRFGLTHRRRLYIGKSGLDLRGEDTLTGDKNSPFKIHFHLHPDIDVLLRQNRTSALIRTKSGSAWHFRISGGALNLEDSVYLGDRAFAKRSRQIVVSGETFDAATTIKWALQPETLAF